MTESFKQQLKELIDQAADENTMFTGDEEVFKQGCEFLMPVLMRAVEQRDQQCIATDSLGRYRMNHTIENLDKELLNILKGETK